MTDYWHSLSMPRLQDLHHHSHSHKTTVAAGCLSDDASDSSTQSMRLFPDTATTIFHPATATTMGMKDIMGTTPPSSSSASASDTEPFRMHSSGDKKTAILTSKTSVSLSLANCSKAPFTSKVPSPSTSTISLASGSSRTGRSHANEHARRLLVARSWSRSRSPLTASVPEGDAIVTNVESSSPAPPQQQQAPLVVKRAKFFFCEDSDDDESDYEQQQEQEQEKEASAYRHPSLIKSADAPLVRTSTASRLPVFLPTVNDDQEEYEEYDEYDEYDHEEEEEDDDEDEEDGPLFFGKKKPSIAVISSSQPRQKPTILTPTPKYGNSTGRHSHLPPLPQNAGMERRQSLLSDLLLAEKQQRQLLLLQQQSQRSLASSTCSTPNCLSAANSDGEGCTSSSSSSSSGNGNGRPRFSTTALTPLYPAPSTTTATTPMPQHLSQHQHQTLEPNRRRTFVDPLSETEPDNLIKDDKIFLDKIQEEEESFVVPKLVRTKKIYHRLDTLAATASAIAAAPITTSVISPTAASSSSSSSAVASAHSPLSPTTCTITTLSPTTTPTTTTKTTVAPIAACATAPRGGAGGSSTTTTTSAASAAATAAAAASASAATMAGWARSQVQFQLHSFVAQSQTTAQRAFLTAQSTLSDVLYRTGAK
ncbi:hypothetical protein KI688_006966 [Linnemannia hyalina]|uniref:Uncharacterized protein n=1 Tax=Linnemannia hyalina TaxID=64524 RepID=A0A9P7XI28_9FUNG|nr:hypothetical protein KI688_006966 [Linnemannia hyalina]